MSFRLGSFIETATKQSASGRGTKQTIPTRTRNLSNGVGGSVRNERPVAARVNHSNVVAERNPGHGYSTRN